MASTQGPFRVLARERARATAPDHTAAASWHRTPWRSIQPSVRRLKVGTETHGHIPARECPHVTATDHSGGMPGPLLVQVRDTLCRPQAHRVDPVAGQDASTRQEASLFPVRQAKFRTLERELAIHPPCEPIAHERGIDRAEEPRLGVSVRRQQGRHEPRTLRIEEHHCCCNIGHHVNGDFGRPLPLPLMPKGRVADR